MDRLETSREYSKRLGVLRASQLQAALDRFDLGKLLAAEPAAGGLFGQNVLLRATSGEYVLRGRPHSDRTGRDIRQLQKERLGAQLIHERTSVPAPWPYRVEESPGIFGWSFAIMPRLPGASFAQPEARAALSRADWEKLASALGEGLGELHSLAFSEPAFFDPEREELVPAAEPHAERVAGRIREHLAHCRTLSQATTPEDVAWVESMLVHGQDALALDFEPTFVHHDYTWGNTVFERGGRRWRLSGLFDLMEWYAGDPEEDLARAGSDLAGVHPDLARSFLSAYFAARPRRSGARERLAIYVIADRVVIWHHLQVNRLWKERERTFRDWVEPVLSGVLGALAGGGAG